jgi:UDP-N-acetyl-D-mannosaminuronic acid dehydrogenase
VRRVVVQKKSFRVTEGYDDIKDADYVLIDVQTPVEKDHRPRYESLTEVSRRISGLIKQGALVCVESTVAPGTTSHLVKPALEASGRVAGKDFHLAFSYERVMVGRLLHNILNYPRIVGGLTPECGKRAVELYRWVVKAPVVATDCLTAEVSKTVENAYRDVNIAFSNEVALMCESLGVNVFEVRELVNNLPNDPSNPAANPVRNMHLPGAGVGVGVGPGGGVGAGSTMGGKASMTLCAMGLPPHNIHSAAWVVMWRPLESQPVSGSNCLAFSFWNTRNIMRTLV